MGVLLLVLTPCLYCNVSDSWMLPNKWHRAAIGAAGMYVELVMASIATFLWWFSEPGLLNNLCLSVMFVCSVTTLVFNANPLMRYDGYYVLADWIEIPNLREKSNRYLQNLFLEKCLGVEVPPEEYMDPLRKAGFVFYAVVSYLYRWIVTFGILYLFHTFLKPYKLVAREWHRANTVIDVGGVPIGGKTVQVIAGPCSVETHPQMHAAAEGARAGGAQLMRAR